MGEFPQEGKFGSTLTYDAERFAGKSEAPLPSAVTAATAGGPDPEDVFCSEHHDHDKFLPGANSDLKSKVWDFYGLALYVN